MPGKKILLDAPTDRPALGYEGIASALAGIITSSQPNFAIGLFGGWGSGKTTLMGAIKKALPSDGLVVVDFNAWRFEREPQLLVPLLDTVREALLEYSQDQPSTTRALRAIVERLGKIVRALAVGLSLSVGLPHTVTVRYDTKTALDALDDMSSGRSELGLKSLYAAAFRELRNTFAGLQSAGVTRLVVFVDDLDRCLPSSALDVLESIKLFFDLPGFVFVVGMDESVIDQAISVKFNAASGAPARLSGREYGKKIFQIPYSLPAMLPQQLDDLLPAMYAEAQIAGEQFEDLKVRVRPYLEVIAVQRRVNPREVKRFVNSYTLQTLIRPDLDPAVILALQTLAFRHDWLETYTAAERDPNNFAEGLISFRSNSAKAPEDLIPQLRELSNELAEFLRSDLAAPLTKGDLEPYISSLGAATSTPRLDFMSRKGPRNSNYGMRTPYRRPDSQDEPGSGFYDQPDSYRISGNYRRPDRRGQSKIVPKDSAELRTSSIWRA